MKKLILAFGALFLLAPAIHAADAVTISTQTLNSNRAIIAYTNISDGTGEAAVSKLSIANLPGAPAKVRILKIWWITSGMDVRVLFDHTTYDHALTLSGYGEADFSRFGGLKDPGSAGGTGNILFTTVGHTTGDSYSIVLEVTY